jgi:hypothetical protein
MIDLGYSKLEEYVTNRNHKYATIYIGYATVNLSD